jgi:ABC-2 type transport system ATP-binding protein
VAVVAVKGLHKSYGPLEAVAGVDLTVEEGEVFALLGPNGAGKTTTVEILEGFRSRNAGEVSVLGFDPASRDRQLRERIGIVLQSAGVEAYLTIAEVVDLYRGYYPRPRDRDELLRVVGLEDRARSRVGTLSGGQRRRLDLAVGLCGNPDLLFLDEPTTGFDPQARHQAWDLVRSLTHNGTTVLLTTHFMDEAQVLADRLAVVVAGRIVAQGTPEEIVARAPRATRVRFGLPDGTAPPAALGPAQRSEGGTWELLADDPVPLLHDLTGWAMQASVTVSDLSVTRPSLEETYLLLTGDARAQAAGRNGEPAAGPSASGSSGTAS